MATLVFSTTACLDKYPDDMVPADKAITTVDEVDQAIIGIYASWLNGALYSGYLTLLPDIQADLAYAVNGYSNQFGNTWRWNILATEPEYESVYAGLYNVITRCNFMLDNVDRVRQNTTNDDDLDRLDQYCGEAYFARALAYSELIKLFSELPLVSDCSCGLRSKPLCQRFRSCRRKPSIYNSRTRSSSIISSQFCALTEILPLPP
jgi:starch-binding outer membrane protein, SusD/RagB family